MRKHFHHYWRQITSTQLTNELTTCIGHIIRRYFKKGKLVEDLSDEDILNIARKINNMPRKALGYKTPLEVFESNLKKKGIDTSFLDTYRIKLPKCLVA